MADITCDCCGQPVTGVSLIAAERARQIRKGYTPEFDLRHKPRDFQWVMFSVIDRYDPPEGSRVNLAKPPMMWPWADDRWVGGPDQTPIQMLAINGAFSASEIDRRLLLGERP